MEYAVFTLLLIVGLVVIWQGYQTMLGKRNLRIRSYERLIWQFMPEGNQATTMRALGVLRMIYGFVLAGMGVYFLLIL